MNCPQRPNVEVYCKTCELLYFLDFSVVLGKLNSKITKCSNFNLIINHFPIKNGIKV